jgi:DNA-binding transcriptional LysR family regulator
VPAWEVDAIPTAKRLVGASDAVGAALLTQIQPELESGALALLPCRTDWMRLNYGFILRRDRSVAPGALEFMAALRVREQALQQQEAALLRRYGRD